MKSEFRVPAEKQRLLREKQLEIQRLFASVTVDLGQVYEDNLWVTVEGPSNDIIDNVKDYINAVCMPKTTENLVLTNDMLSKFKNEEQRNELERNFGIVTTLSGNQLVMQGTELAVAMAASSIEDQRQPSHEPVDVLNPVLKDFALKLGYEEEQVLSVAKKFGSDVDQNKLLQELIHTSASDRHASKVRQLNEPSTETRAIPTSYEMKRDVVSRGTPTSAAPTNSTRGNPVVIPPGSSYAEMHASARGTVASSPDDLAIMMDGGMDLTRDMGSDESRDDGLRAVVIDGSNVAMSHGNQRVFSCRGIALCVQWFQERGHQDITVFVPRWRTESPRVDNPITDQEILFRLEKQDIVTLTPSRRIGGRNIVCYDDRFILDLAAKRDGVVVSNDNFRDLMRENDAWREVIESRLLMYSFARDFFMAPEDPLGKHGPTLDEFLRKGSTNQPRVCPFLGRCTFGPRCRFYHPDRDPTRRQQLLKASHSDPNLSSRDRSSSTPPPTSYQATVTRTSSLDRKRSSSDNTTMRGPSLVPRGPYQEIPPRIHGNPPPRQMLVPEQYGNGGFVHANQRNGHYALYPNHVVPEGHPEGYHGNPGYYRYPLYVPVATQQQYTYIPPHRGYTNSGSRDSSDGDSEDFDAMYAQLKDLFPAEPHDDVMRQILRDNVELCRNRNINELVNKLLENTK